MNNFLILLVTIIVFIIACFNVKYIGILSILDMLDYKSYGWVQIIALICLISIVIISIILSFILLNKSQKILNIFNDNQDKFQLLIKEVKFLSQSNAELKDTVSKLDPDNKIDSLNKNIELLINELKETSKVVSKLNDPFPNRERERRMIDDMILFFEYRKKERLLQKKNEHTYNKEYGRDI